MTTKTTTTTTTQDINDREAFEDGQQDCHFSCGEKATRELENWGVDGSSAFVCEGCADEVRCASADAQFQYDSECGYY